MTKCKACGKEFRTGKRALLLDTDGGSRSVIVCKRCATTRALIVVTREAPPPAPPPVAVSPDIMKAIRQLQVYAKAARAAGALASPGGPTYHHAHGRAEGFEGAIELLKREK